MRRDIQDFINYELNLRRTSEDQNLNIANIEWISMDSRKLFKIQERAELLKLGKTEQAAIVTEQIEELIRQPTHDIVKPV